MRLSRIIMALTVGLAVVAVPTAAGAAQPQPTPSATTDPPQPPPYPPTAASLTVNRPTIYLGETVVLTGTNFGPNETVDITVTVTPQAAPAGGVAPARRSDGTTVAMAPVAYQASAPLHFTAYTDAQGRFTKTYKPSVTGLLTFTATGRESGRTASTELRVLHKKQPLPVTGDSLGTPMKLGGGLVGAGAVMLLLTLAWRRRQRFGGAAH
ncbi:hypothetical protein [Micromonospora saelicesensis]|uniref:Gram-positive cocci surface proteins LPxTG domain-containing protein n=1 Tax=Micromonospora saelicesensis TaxID=285676 RepID=A0A1C4VSP5_9ACTN|nr:hypothetical protein [Micromonospora saelicesensis]RAN95538.1 hypothetical protein GAR05_04203 [Micromonospora saelicesensis]RAO39537.1 hypothetical protein PSN13_00562 [Micromonospora saelicesensis]RAO41455.1 hypothetical protein GAR06_05550 [Micromonospora saelicesensis]RAO55254.1 hypothetical protein PSN01_03581 [Micromonospora saelicesensis]RAO59901.1 hypothetical protein LUPAC06_01589 [Micromonospora saelicesensis]